MILGLDLGTTTGWAALYRDGRIESGVQNFALRRGESPGMRYLRFNRWLRELLDLSEGPLVAYEMPHNRGGYATEVLNGLATRVQEACAERGLDHTSVHSATLKKFATGHGRASKKQMVSAVESCFGRKVVDDNEADAIWVAAWASNEIGGPRPRNARQEES